MSCNKDYGWMEGQPSQDCLGCGGCGRLRNGASCSCIVKLTSSNEFSFQPVNKCLLVELIEEDEQETGILIPKEYKNTPKFSQVKILAMAKDVSLVLEVGEHILVLSTMIETVVVKKQKYCLIPQTAIWGIWKV